LHEQGERKDAQKQEFFWPSSLEVTCTQGLSEILNPNCTVLAGFPLRKTLRFPMKSYIAVSSKELAGKSP